MRNWNRNKFLENQFSIRIRDKEALGRLLLCRFADELAESSEGLQKVAFRFRFFGTRATPKATPMSSHGVMILGKGF